MSSGRPNWRSLASTVTSSVKNIAKGAYEGGYDQVTSRVAAWRGNEGENWQQWRERRREETRGTEKIALFPGYAVRKRTESKPNSPYTNEFQIELFIDGYGSSLRPPQFATRSQKAFMRIAKGFAALPRLPESMAPSGSLIPDDRSDRRKSGDSFDFSNLPPTPNEMTDDVEAETLRPYNLASRNRLQTQRSSPDLSLHSSASSPNSPPFSDSASISGDSTTSMLNNISPDQLALLHANLDARLQPFWSSILSGRVVRVSVFVSPHSDEPLTPKDIIDRAQLDTYGVKPEPIVVEDLITSPQGYFSHKFIIPFEKICTHPPSLSLAFGESTGEHHLVVRAELLPVEVPLEQSTSRGSLDEDGNPARRSGSPSSDSARGATGGGTLPHPSSQLNMMKPTSIVQMAVPLTSARVRLISDIDDTVKETQVLFGVKTIFRNTFVKSLEESVVEGMGDWYTSLYKKGVRFHYVSNSPFELLSVLHEFFEIAGLPPGSVKLKFYGGKNLLHGLWQPAGERKRTGVLEILDQFADSQFFLVGDTGEQDMELYTEIAQERPDQILGIFLRDVSSMLLPGETEPETSTQYTPRSPRPSSPISVRPGAGRDRTSTSLSMTQTPYKVRTRRSDTNPNSPAIDQRSSPVTSYFDGTPTAEEPESYAGIAPAPPSDAPQLALTKPSVSSTLAQRLPGGYFTDNRTLHRSNTSLSSRLDSVDASENPAQLVGVAKRREELRQRANIARARVPPQIPFRIFREPDECVEALKILDKLGL